MATKKTTSAKKNKLTFYKTENGYVLKGKTIEETNTFCRIHAITYKMLEENLNGNVSVIDGD